MNIERRIIKYFINDIEYNGNIFIKKTNITNTFGYESYADSEYTIKLEMRKVIIEHDDHSDYGKIENKMVDKIENQVVDKIENKMVDKIEDNKILYLLCPIIILIKFSFL